MIAILQWTTLAACGVLAAFRVPTALRGENRSLFFIYALMTAAILLSIEAPYVAVDQVLGGVNLANLLLRFIIFGAIFALGLRIARGFGADDALRLITGPAGTAFAAAASLAVVAVFLMMDTAGSSAGLIGVYDKDARNAALVEYYGAAGRLYPAYITLALLPAMVRTVRSSLPGLVRLGAALLALGSIGVTLGLLSPVIPAPLGYLRFVFNYTAILCLLTGLATFWLSKAVAKRTRKMQTNVTG
ncbi:hypothetical protein NicSoilB4_06620 [Arthrobacter sp. NicSoilB4]|uniref:hypothetical protein n=1 Tax=Arthrobacter sp. NicSoilB4 TaxID=2830997 RepID=UPI001CC61B2A|nr:hypothetical protein [Arthrobacter sp. NicSoilB4]BCW65899.1 hypothetical protein NicSoilB4_06620 [Arthrobacter sp. NicSoilB4]